MSVRLLIGKTIHVDGIAIEDFEIMAEGSTEIVPQVNGNNGMVLYEGIGLPRQG